VLIRNLPVEVRIPTTRSIQEIAGETSWCVFPTKVDGGENPEHWLTNPPSIEMLLDKDRRKLRIKLELVVSAIRSTRLHLMGVTESHPEIKGLLSGVHSDLENAARSIVSNDDAGRGSALWSMQVAIERTVKAFSLQKTSSYKETHDLFLLYDAVADHCGTVPRKLLKKIPNSRSMIDGRYGLEVTFTISYVVTAYMATLSIIAGFSKLFERKLGFGAEGFRILVKRPPWTTLPLSGSEANKKDVQDNKDFK
jgi:hypothetical protein